MVIGSVNRDVVSRVERLPRPGETVLARHAGPATLGGKGANQAVAAARLGATVEMVGVVGASDRDVLAGELTAFGVGTAWLSEARRPTGWAHVVVDAKGDNLIIVHPGANDALTGDYVARTVRSGRPSVVLTQCEIGVTVAAGALQIGREIGATTICNASPAVDLAHLGMRNIDVLVLNRVEAELMSSEIRLDCAARVLADRTGGTVVVTLGADGLIVADAGSVRAIPAVSALRVLDSTGAGDVFAGALARGIVLGQSVADAVGLAQRAASWTVSRLGTFGPRLQDL